MNSNSKIDLLLPSHSVVKLSCGFLNLIGAVHCVQGVWKFNKKSVAYGFHFSAIELGDDRSDKSPLGLQNIQRKRLVSLCESCVADHVSEHDCGELSLLLRRHVLVILSVVLRR